MSEDKKLYNSLHESFKLHIVVILFLNCPLILGAKVCRHYICKAMFATTECCELRVTFLLVSMIILWLVEEELWTL
jgi:uncharacterized membrane protein YsdA (DUF1294 family)